MVFTISPLAMPAKPASNQGKMARRFARNKQDALLVADARRGTFGQWEPGTGSRSSATASSVCARPLAASVLSHGGEGTVSRFLKACLNGPREPSEHPALPVTPAAIAADAAAAVAAGADALHIHPKDPAGRDTLEPDVVASVLEAVRAAVPGVAVGLARPPTARKRLLDC